MAKLLQDVSIEQNLKYLRKLKGYTQEELCIKMTLKGRPMSRTTYSQIETGVRNIFISDLLVLKDILHTTFDELFRDIQPVIKTEDE